jgi:hypothetical protein
MNNERLPRQARDKRAELCVCRAEGSGVNFVFSHLLPSGYNIAPRPLIVKKSPLCFRFPSRLSRAHLGKWSRFTVKRTLSSKRTGVALRFLFFSPYVSLWSFQPRGFQSRRMQ